MITIFRGDDNDFLLTFFEDGNVIDITGDTVFFTAKKHSTDPDSEAVISKDITIHSDPVNGQSVLSITNTDSSIPIGIYHFDIQLVTSTGKVHTEEKDLIKIIQDVTERTS